MEETLQTKNVDILKINTSELKSLTGKAELEDAARTCFEKYGIKWLAITSGSHPSHLFQRSDSSETETIAAHFVYKVPKMEIVNPIGAGVIKDE